MSKANAALEEFRKKTPEFREFDTLANLVLFVNYINGEWGRDSGASESSSSWEIAFLGLKDKLKPIPNYQPPTTPEFRDRVNRMSGSEAREVYQRDSDFKKQFDQLAKEDSDWSQPAPDPYRNLSATGYRSIDATTRAILLTRNAQFQNAVQRLRDRGEI